MKNGHVLLVVISLLFSFSISAQEEKQKTVKRINIYDVCLWDGQFLERSTISSLHVFRELAPESVLLKNDFTNYSTLRLLNLTNNPMYSAFFGIKLRNKEKTAYKTNSHLRIGLSYFSGTSLTYTIYKSDRKTYYTLINAGQTTYFDSVTTKSYNMFYSSEQFRLDGSLIYHTNPQSGWSLFSGIGITAGFSINAATSIYYSHDEKTEARNSTSSNSSPPLIFDFEDMKSEKFRNKNNFGSSVFIPMGIDFRIGKKKEFWKRIHLFYEARPGVNITFIQKKQFAANASLQHGFGLRISWD